MNREEAIISLYLTIEAAYREVTQGQAIRQCGRQPNLSDAEAITIEVFGEMQRLHDDAAIWRYADAHWRDWFPKLGSYKAYVKQIANLASIKQRIFAHLFAPQDDVHITDGVPMAICHLARASRSKLFRGEAAFGFCAAKDEHYIITASKATSLSTCNNRLLASRLHPLTSTNVTFLIICVAYCRGF